jgi:iron complex outermembrane receptor protein/vitamin B12 transporter
LNVTGGGHYDREQGFSDPTQPASTTRDNGGVFVEGRGTVAHRVGITAGVGYEHNAVFKSATTPRVSVVVFLRNPTTAEAFSDTKLVFNAGKGIKAPAIYQADSSLYAILQQTPEGAALAAASGLSPIGPERSRTIDVGIEQGLAGGRARVRAAYFDNHFSDLIEFVSDSVLPQLGIPPAAAAATGFGAYVNSQSYDAKGVETSIDIFWAQRLRVGASYTFLDATVTKSLSGGALSPAENPSIPGVQIGAFAPLVGQRPFNRPPNVGTVLVSYTEGPAVAAVTGHFAGKSDGSTFLSDREFESSMLLPNRDLNDAYQKIDLSGSYRLHRMLRAYVSVENVLDKRYAPVIGFPALPVTARAGVTITLGGDR